MCFNDWLSRRRLLTPDRTGVVDDTSGRRYSYAELDERASRVAGMLRANLGVRPGDRVACLSGNRIEYLDLYFACGKIGAVLVPLNTRLPTLALLELLKDCQAKILIHQAAFQAIANVARQANVVRLSWPIDERDADSAEPALTEAAADSSVSEVSARDLYRAEEADAAMVLYTSGTTGRAKGAIVTYRQIHWNALNTIIGLQLTENDTTFQNMPLYHTGGWHVLLTPLMLVGGKVVLQQRFDAERCNALLGPEGITILFGVPTALKMMWEAPNFAKADFTDVRFAIFGGESCPLPVIEAFAERGVAMRQGYGLTEAGPNCFSLPADDAIRKQGSIGFPNFHVQARLRKEDGTEADVGEVGELLMSGPHLFGGYWQNPQATDQAIRDGWLATGDLMTRDQEGYYYVVGRKKEMYVSGGENVYPAQVERILHDHEAVALAAVIGVPDAKWGETGWAFVQLHEEMTSDELELLSWSRQHLARFQCPSRIVIVEELPLGNSGKINKLALAEQVQEMDRP